MPESISAEFDGRVIIPDQPLSYPPGQRLRVTVEALGADQDHPGDEGLPPELERRDDGVIVVRGYRVSLHVILDDVYRDKPLESIVARYPHIGEDTIRRVIDFCRDHDEFARKYYQQQRSIAHELCDAEHQGPSVGELRQLQPPVGVSRLV